jgi:esterase/lipase superfamily enzyme
MAADVDLDVFRAQLAELAKHASMYHVLAETEDGVLFDAPFMGSDAVQVLAMAGIHGLSYFTTAEHMPPTKQLVVRITPIDDPEGTT